MRIYRRADGSVAREREGQQALVPVDSVAALLRLPLHEMRVLLSGDLPAVEPAPTVAPVDGRTEVWASGVTYLRSRSARMEEASDPDIYDRVYAAERPELFFKSTAWRAVSDGDEIGIREDSSWNVPEPELAVIANAFGEVVGYAVSNDVSSRSIEGENPLYLPQAKVYAGACAVGAMIRPAWEVDATGLEITLRITRGGEVLVDDSTSTDRLARSIDDLVAYLYRAMTFPDGAWLSTGTGIVPPDDFSLEDGDVVQIDISELGSLTNVVRRGRDRWNHLEHR